MNTQLTELRTALYVSGSSSLEFNKKIPPLLDSGFNTLILSFIDVNDRGDLVIGDKLIASGGKYTGPPEMPQTLRSLLKSENGGVGSVTRLGFSVGGAERDDYRFMWKSFVQPTPVINGVHDMFPTNNMLVENMLALRETFSFIDFIDLDCEEFDWIVDPTYDWKATVISFAYLASNVGFKVSLCPFHAYQFWIEAYNTLLSLNVDIDAIYLQNYEGGGDGSAAAPTKFAIDLYLATLDPSACRRIVPGLIAPYLVGSDVKGMSPAQVQAALATYPLPSGITIGDNIHIPPIMYGGAFIYDYGMIVDWYKCQPKKPCPALVDYSTAITNGLANQT